jgi:hypothetical protein
VSTKFDKKQNIWGQIGPALGVHWFSLYLYIKKLKTSSLKKTQRARVLVFGMKHLLVTVYQVCSNKSSGVKIFPILCGVIGFPYIYSKNLKIFF